MRWLPWGSRCKSESDSGSWPGLQGEIREPRTSGWGWKPGGWRRAGRRACRSGSRNWEPGHSSGWCGSPGSWRWWHWLLPQPGKQNKKWFKNESKKCLLYKKQVKNHVKPGTNNCTFLPKKYRKKPKEKLQTLKNYWWIILWQSNPNLKL